MHAILRLVRRYSTRSLVVRPSLSSSPRTIFSSPILLQLRAVLGISLPQHHHLLHTISADDEDSEAKKKAASSVAESPGFVNGDDEAATIHEHEREPLWKMDKQAEAQAMALLRIALDEDGDDDGEVNRVVREEDQKSLRVGIVGAPNAGKSKLTNLLVGSKVSAVSRKTNTTHREHMGVCTKGDTQLVFFDTPGLTVDVKGHPLRVDNRSRVRSAWQTAEFCEALIVLVDAHRQTQRRDGRVCRLVEKLGNEVNVSQKKVLCFNKVDLIEPKRLLLPLAQEFGELPAFDRVFMISSLTGNGVEDLEAYLMDQAVLRPWEEEADSTPQRLAKATALEVVRQHIFDSLHKELPYRIEQQHISWKVLKDGSIRIQQLLLVEKEGHRKILIGKNGDVIRRIGTVARMELQKVLNATVHLVLDVKVMSEQSYSSPFEYDLLSHQVL